jgi:hypothetical protein
LLYCSVLQTAFLDMADFTVAGRNLLLW